MSHQLSLSSQIPFCHPTDTIQRHIGHGLKLEIKTPCAGFALRTIWDIETALEHGAFPAANVVMIDIINQANEKGRPLELSLGYTLP